MEDGAGQRAIGKDRPAEVSVGKIGLVEGTVGEARGRHLTAAEGGVAQLAAVEMHAEQQVAAGPKRNAQQLAVGKDHILQSGLGELRQGYVAALEAAIGETQATERGPAEIGADKVVLLELGALGQ